MIHPIPDAAFETLSHVAASWSDERYVVIGAVALLAHGVRLMRNTNDVDLVVAVGADDLPALRRRLSPPGWEFKHREPHHFRHYGASLSLDVLPSARSPERIQLGRGQELDLRGCEVALDHAMSVRVATTSGPTLSIPVPPLPVIALLKLIALDDNPQLRGKDVDDIVLIARHLLPDDDPARWEPPLSEIADHELQCMSMLGRAMRRYAEPAYVAIPERVLGGAEVVGRLEALFASSPRFIGELLDDDGPRTWGGESIVAAFLRGFHDPY